MRIKQSTVCFPLYFILCFVVGTGKVNYFEYLAIGVIILGMLFDKRENIIMYLAAFLPWYPAIGTKYAEIVVYAFIFIYSIRTQNERSSNVDKSTIGLLGVAIVSCGLGSVTNIGAVIQYAVPLFLGLFIVLRQNTKENTIKISEIFAISCVLCGIMACFGGLFPKLIKYSDQFVMYNVSNYYESLLHGNIVRFSSLDTDANFSSYNFLMAIAMMYVSYSKNNRRFGVKEIVLMGIMFVFGAFSISVTFYITAFIFFGCIVIFNDRKRGLLYIAIAAVLVIIGLSIFKNQVNIFLSVYNARISEANIGERSVIWMEYWNAIKSNPLSLLIGRGALAKLQITAHSTLFRMLFMNGILGTILIINYIIEHTLKAKSAKQWLDFSMFPLVVPFVIYNLVLDAMRENGAYMILLYVMMIYFLYGERGKDFEGRYEVRVDE